MTEPTKALIQAVAVAVELTSTELSSVAADVMCRDLALYPERQVLRALERCRRELKGRLAIQDVIARLEDGRPGAEEAWAMMPLDESMTVVWTAEMVAAFEVATPLLQAGDAIAARMAFKQAYERSVIEARTQRKPIEWSVSLGWDARGREPVVARAVAKGYITMERALKALPHGTFEETRIHDDLRALSGPEAIGDITKRIEHTAALRAVLLPEKTS